VSQTDLIYAQLIRIDLDLANVSQT